MLIVYPENDPDFKRDVELARQYLPLLDQYFKELNKLDADLYLERIGNGEEPTFQEAYNDEDQCGNISEYSQPAKIFWNPTEGNRILDGTNSIQSPALILLHEFAHAHQYMTNFPMFDQGKMNFRDDGYTDDEEYRVITGPEAVAAQAAGEPTRNCHRPVSGNGSKCTEAVYDMPSVDYSVNTQTGGGE